MGNKLQRTYVEHHNIHMTGQMQHPALKRSNTKLINSKIKAERAAFKQGRRRGIINPVQVSTWVGPAGKSARG